MNRWDLNQPVIWLTPRDALTWAELYMHQLILGCTGSGKTSASARLLITTMMAHGAGGLFLTVKSTDVEMLRNYARQTGRLHDVVVISPGSGWYFDWFNYECARSAGQTENLVRRLLALVKLADQGSGQGHDADGGFWQRALMQLIRNAIEIVKVATKTVRLTDLYELVRSAPISSEQLESEAWRDNSFAFRLCLTAEQRTDLTEGERRDVQAALKYFFGEWPRLAERTKSVIELSFVSVIDLFQRGVLADLFCSGRTNVVPEMCYDGALIVLDLPVKQWGEVGRIGQSAFRLAWQAAMERRIVDNNSRACVLYIDEAQNFLLSDDALFLTTARSSRVATLLISQNIPALGSALGQGEAGKQVAEAVLATIGTKIFHAQSCPITNTWAADLIAKQWQARLQVGSGGVPTQQAYQLRHDLQNHSTNASVSEVLEYSVLPGEFTTLKMAGGPDRMSEGVVVQAGRRWSHGGNALRVLFPQS
jgi:hypothetical protein